MKTGYWHRAFACGCLGLLLLTSSPAMADDDLGVTMRMVTDDELTESVVREIELREPVARERRNGKADKPATTASDARERGREAARAASDRAREARDRNDLRGRPELPERPGVSNRPGRPELP